MKKISIIVPVYYNHDNLLPLYADLKEKVFNKLKENTNTEYELIRVDDGSKDKTLELLEEYSKKDKRVRFISFSRNFGKEAAMIAGLEYSKGDFVTLMDADLQDPPSLLPEMYNYIVKEGYDCVGTRRITRKGEPKIRSFFSKMFYKIINKMSKIEMVDGARDYRLMNRRMVDSIISMKEYNRYSKGIFSFVGFKTKWLEFENVERVAGKTKWNFWKLFRYAVEGIVGYSTAPLIFSVFIGLLFCFLSFIMIIAIIIKTILYGDPVSGWPSLVCVIFFVGGVQLFVMGIMGAYLSKTYLETKNRPVYIVRKTEED